MSTPEQMAYASGYSDGAQDGIRAVDILEGRLDRITAERDGLRKALEGVIKNPIPSIHSATPENIAASMAAYEEAHTALATSSDTDAVEKGGS